MTQNNSTETLEHKAEEYLSGWKRAQADFINYKKDEKRRMEEFVNFADESLILELLPVLDNLELTVTHDENSRKVLEPIAKQFIKVLGGHGVERIPIKNQKFNPTLHEAVSGSSADGATLEEIRAGYTMKDKVIRPSRVLIT